MQHKYTDMIVLSNSRQYIINNFLLIKLRLSTITRIILYNQYKSHMCPQTNEMTLLSLLLNVAIIFMALLRNPF